MFLSEQIVTHKPPFQISEVVAGHRLDRLLSDALGVSRRHARRYLEQGLVRVNGRKSVPGYVVTGTDSIEFLGVITPPAARPEMALEAPESLVVLYEDERVLCVSKPRGMPSVVHESTDPLTLADLVAHHAPSTVSASDDPRQSGLVQRLDHWSSGAILAAKDPEAYQLLRTELFEHRIEKTYIALAEGEPTPANRVVRWPLAQSKSGKKMEVVRVTGPSSENKGSPTTVQRIKTLHTTDVTASFVRCSIARAERHQVRCHLASCGHPLVGDALYGSTRSLADIDPVLFASLNASETGFFLHARSVTFRLPWQQSAITVVAPSAVLDAVGITE